MEGWISLHRKILDNPILNRSRKYSPFEAWIWLLLKANHKDNKFMLGSELVKVEKGSMITSQKKLCKQFRWGSTKLRNFLKVLQKDKMLIIRNMFLDVINNENGSMQPFKLIFERDTTIKDLTTIIPKYIDINLRNKEVEVIFNA